MMTRLIAILMVLVLLGGCEILGPDKDKDDDNGNRTYPEALNLPVADLQKIMDGQHPPGRYNLTAYVVGISECPPTYACLIADNIQVASSPHTDGIPLMIAAEKPSQFTLDQRYVLSIEVFNDSFPESSQSRFVRLLAWSRAR